ncbi:hypothetical protein J9303_10690 [Bacillaceae bacterium Marseille-Q3522]|nr:hypothetical protein [Bacillaceae bacterium Marseille-Q3522]
MAYSNEQYPEAFNNLEPEVREKAIDFMNSLLAQNYDEGQAISMAMDKAQELNTVKDNINFYM